jgi:hypothetical protein
MSKPATEESHHLRIGVCETHLTIRLAPLPRVQRDPGHEELPVGQAADAVPALLDQPVDLSLAAALRGVGGTAAAPGRPRAGLERDVADPERDAAPGDAEAGGDLGQGQAGAAQLACLLAFGELAPVAHGRILA